MPHNMQTTAQVAAILKPMAAEVMGAEVDAEVPLMSAGLDSLGAVELRNGISAKFGISLPATFSFDYSTLQVAHIPNGAKTIISPPLRPVPVYESTAVASHCLASLVCITRQF